MRSGLMEQGAVQQFTDKLIAFAIHLLISGVLFCTVFYVLFVLWYPEPLFSIDGGWQGVKLVALVDLVLGPFLTLIVYRVGKKGLVWDMSLIAFLQISCMIYGVLVLYTSRPVALVFYQGVFYSMDSSKYAKQADGLDRIKAVTGKLPGFVYVKLPEDFDEVRRLRRLATAKGESLFAQIDHYSPIEEILSQMPGHGRDISGYLSEYPESKAKVDQWLKHRGSRLEDYAYIPALSRFQNTLLAVDKESGRIVGDLDLDIPHEIELPYVSKIQFGASVSAQ